MSAHMGPLVSVRMPSSTHTSILPASGGEAIIGYALRDEDARLWAAAPELLKTLERTEGMLRAVSEYLLGANPFLGQPDASKHEREGVSGNTAAARRVAELIAPTVAVITKARGGK